MHTLAWRLKFAMWPSMCPLCCGYGPLLFFVSPLVENMDSHGVSLSVAHMHFDTSAGPLELRIWSPKLGCGHLICCFGLSVDHVAPRVLDKDYHASVGRFSIEVYIPPFALAGCVSKYYPKISLRPRKLRIQSPIFRSARLGWGHSSRVFHVAPRVTDIGPHALGLPLHWGISR